MMFVGIGGDVAGPEYHWKGGCADATFCAEFLAD